MKTSQINRNGVVLVMAVPLQSKYLTRDVGDEREGKFSMSAKTLY